MKKHLLLTCICTIFSKKSMSESLFVRILSWSNIGLLGKALTVCPRRPINSWRQIWKRDHRESHCLNISKYMGIDIKKTPYENFIHIFLREVKFHHYMCTYTYRKFSEISAALGNSATIINLPNNYWGNSPTPNSSKDTFHQKSATK